MKSFLKESDTKISQSIHFADEVGIISSYSNRILRELNDSSHSYEFGVYSP